jgi:hypothetical protein
MTKSLHIVFYVVKNHLLLEAWQFLRLNNILKLDRRLIMYLRKETFDFVLPKYFTISEGKRIIMLFKNNLGIFLIILFVQLF